MIKELTKKYLKNLKIDNLNDIQNSVIETFSSKNDIIVYAPTGFGKTIGFLMPIFLNTTFKKNTCQVLILAPARELALQIEQVCKQFSALDCKINSCYGGHSMSIEKNNLSVTPNILIGTPGRIADHLRRDNISLSEIEHVVLDEFDKSLEFGFLNEMEFIFKYIPMSCKKVLTSATIIKEIPEFTHLQKPQLIDYLHLKKDIDIEHFKVKAEGNDKLEILIQLLYNIGNETCIVFCNHREAVERISELLHDQLIPHDIFHGGMKQEDRERSLIKFRNGSHNILITTDLASRGLDIPSIKNVIHYQLPTTKEAFTHRNGRTARMNASGKSFLIMKDSDFVPDFINEKISDVEIDIDNQQELSSEWTTLYFGQGKKQKIGKIDIAGLLYKKANLSKEDVGIIDILDNCSFVAVKTHSAKKIVKLIANEQIKGKKIKIQISK